MAFLTDRPVSQGELDFWLVSPDHFDSEAQTAMEPTGAHYVLAHSESGNHHVLECETAQVFTLPASEGLTMLRAIVKAPTRVRNLSPGGHADLALLAGDYLVIKRRELGLDDVIRSSAD
jgi:hypothetical protein